MLIISTIIVLDLIQLYNLHNTSDKSCVLTLVAVYMPIIVLNYFQRIFLTLQLVLHETRWLHPLSVYAIEDSWILILLYKKRLNSPSNVLQFHLFETN